VTFYIILIYVVAFVGGIAYALYEERGNHEPA